MTSQKDQIQALIAEIDSVLQKANSRLPWIMSGEIAQQRQVLERVRNYLVVLQQQLPLDGLRQEETYSSSVGYPPEFYPSGASGSSLAVDAEKMMQTILQEMSYLRANVMQPMHADLENLRQRRELLTQELSHLEAERQVQPLAQLPSNPQQFTDELVQVLMSRLQESLSQQIGQALGIQAQALSDGANSSGLGEPLPGTLANPRYEQLQALRSRSDQMLVNLDSTLNIVFESLQRNIQTYQISLTQGLERMYSLGQQSEVAFKALVSELAQQLNQEASFYLLSLAQGQAAIDPKTANPAHRQSFNRLPEPLLESTTEPAIARPPNPSPIPALSRSVLATDLSTANPIGSIAAEDKSLPPMPELDAALESWLRSADTSNFDAAELISSSLGLGIPLNDSAPAQPEVFPYLSDAEIPVGSPVESFANVSQIAVSDGLTSALAMTDEDTAELDDALKLLEELGSELNNPLLTTQPVEDSFVEQDEFYQSLFGDSAIAEAEPEAIASLNDRSNDFFPEATPEAAELNHELDNIDHAATLADLTFESIGSDLELPELFFEAAAETETTAITELPASLFDHGSTIAPSLEPFPLTAETESLLTDLEPFSLEPDSVGSLSDLFQDLPPESAQSTPVDPPAIAIDWASLQEPAPMANTAQSVQSDALSIGLPDSEFALEGREDQFTRAALDENLLPDVFHEVANLNIDLDAFTLNSLSEDLSNVETSTTWQPDRVTDDLPSLDEFALFLEDSSHETGQPLDQSLSDRADLTVEEFGTLFDDAPNISPQIPPPPVVSSNLLAFSLQETQSAAEPLSTSATQLPPPPQVADDGSLPFTLEGMDDLFGDAPDIVAVPFPPAPQPDLSDSSLSSLEMQDFFGADPSPTGTESLPFTLEGMDDLFSDAPSVQITSPPTPRPTAKEILPFKPDYGRPDYGQQPAEDATPFKLEQLDNLDQLDNLLTAAPPMSPASPDGGSQENTSNPLATDSLPSLPENPSDAPVNLGLDEAFESLLGKPTPLQPSTLSEQAKEKKDALAASVPKDLDEENLGRSDASEARRVARSPWYLGVDIGTTALSASLFNLETGRQYAIAWIKKTAQGQLSLAALPSGLHSFKPYLNLAIPYFLPATQQWEPLMVRSPTQQTPLIQVQHQLTILLATLKIADSNLSCTAEGLDDLAFQSALQQLAGVVVNQPVGASDAYRFNIREAVLAAGLVSQPENIFFVEEVVAALLAELHQPSTTTATVLQAPITLSGGVLVLSAGATTTELALIQAPPAGVNLTRAEVQQRRLPYAGNAIDQDIICQLIHPTTSDWDDLRLGNLDLPLPGEPDLEARYILQQQLEGSLHGQKLLNTVRKIKPSLCQHDIEAIADSPKTALKHGDFYSWVLSPYLQQLNRELNLLLSQSGMTADQIQRVVCTGGTGSIPAIAQWLQQKFPQAQVVQDVCNSEDDSRRDRIAKGLAVLPRFPQILDGIRHQYSDYFLLQELLKLPVQTNEALSASQILQRLEQQGVNVAACQSTLLGFLNGQLPTGLVPSKATALLITSSQTADYQALTAVSLFSRQDHHYRLNSKQRDRLWHHLQTILAQTHQTLEVPLTVGLKEVKGSL